MVKSVGAKLRVSFARLMTVRKKVQTTGMMTETKTAPQTGKRSSTSCVESGVAGLGVGVGVGDGVTIGVTGDGVGVGVGVVEIYATSASSVIMTSERLTRMAHSTSASMP